ncbi:hypothetical protein U0070_018324 [Myodes glareolus]|uniref:Metalloendopeptidase OMA1, mitochondrial n=1 Tax=Myodes glareolus TaxID=447135 RepID=A0AAW0JUA6_MYOGA
MWVPESQLTSWFFPSFREVSDSCEQLVLSRREGPVRTPGPLCARLCSYALPIRSSYRPIAEQKQDELPVWTAVCHEKPFSLWSEFPGQLETVETTRLSTSTKALGARAARSFHTSPRALAAPAPLLLLILKPVQKLLAIIVGSDTLVELLLWAAHSRSQCQGSFSSSLLGCRLSWSLRTSGKSSSERGIRKWWQALPPNKKELFKDSVKKNKWKLLLGLSASGLLFVVLYFTHLEVSPVTGRSKLLLLGKEHFRLLADLEYQVWMEEFKDAMLPERDPRYLTVKEVVYHLTQCNQDVPGISEINWVIHVVDSPDVNAFVLPNGQVFVFTGLLGSVTDTHQLSFLLGHEIAHAVLGHAAEKASLVHLLDFLGMIFLTMIWAVCPRDSLALLGQWIQSKLQEYVFDRPYSRTLEAEADKIGLQLAAKFTNPHLYRSAVNSLSSSRRALLSRKETQYEGFEHSVYAALFCESILLDTNASSSSYCLFSQCCAVQEVWSLPDPLRSSSIKEILSQKTKKKKEEEEKEEEKEEEEEEEEKEEEEEEEEELH